MVEMNASTKPKSFFRQGPEVNLDRTAVPFKALAKAG